MTKQRIACLAQVALIAGLCWDSLAAAPDSSSKAPHAKTPLPVEDVVNVAEYRDVDLSPDGAWLAYRFGDDRTRGIRLEETGKSGAVELMSVQGLNDGTAWSPDSQHLAYFTQGNRRYLAGGKRQEIAAGRLWIWDRTSRTSHPVEAVDILGNPIWFEDSARLLVPLWPEGVAKPAADSTPESRSPFRPPFPAVAADALSVYVYSANQKTDSDGNTSAPIEQNASADFPADLGIIDLRSGQVTRVVRKTSLAGFYAPSPDGRHIAYSTRKRWAADQQLHVFDLHLVDMTSARDRVIAPDLYNYGKSFGWSPDGQSLVHLVLRTKYDGRGSRYSAQPADLAITSVKDGATSVLGKEGHPVFRGSEPAIWSRDSRHLYAVDVERGLWEMDIESGNAQPITSSLDGKIQQVKGLGSGGALLKVESAGGTAAAIYELDTRNGVLSRLFEQSSKLAAVDASDGAASVAFVTTSQQSPGALWLWQQRGKTARQIGSLNRFLDRHLLGEARKITWRTADGSDLAGALLLPQSYRPGQQLPLYVQVYGGLSGSRYLDRFGLVGAAMDNMQILASRGYAVLYPDIPQRLGTPMQDIFRAVMPGVDAAIAQGFVDPERLAVGGHSYGSYTALALITQTTRFKAAIIAGVVDANLVSNYLQLKPNGSSHDDWAENGQGLMGGTPWQYPDRYRDNSPIFLFDRIATPLLIGQGEVDTATPITGANSILSALRRLGKPVEYRIYENEGHVIHRPANVIDWWNRRLDFLAVHLDIQLDDQGRVMLENGRAKSRKTGS